jgi:hypothetical protein
MLPLPSSIDVDAAAAESPAAGAATSPFSTCSFSSTWTATPPRDEVSNKKAEKTKKSFFLLGFFRHVSTASARRPSATQIRSTQYKRDSPRRHRHHRLRRERERKKRRKKPESRESAGEKNSNLLSSPWQPRTTSPCGLAAAAAGFATALPAFLRASFLPISNRISLWGCEERVSVLWAVSLKRNSVSQTCSFFARSQHVLSRS